MALAVGSRAQSLTALGGLLTVDALAKDFP